jgi:CSLREA domain-containing protein
MSPRQFFNKILSQTERAPQGSETTSAQTGIRERKGFRWLTRRGLPILVVALLVGLLPSVTNSQFAQAQSSDDKCDPENSLLATISPTIRQRKPSPTSTQVESWFSFAPRGGYRNYTLTVVEYGPIPLFPNLKGRSHGINLDSNPPAGANPSIMHLAKGGNIEVVNHVSGGDDVLASAIAQIIANYASITGKAEVRCIPVPIPPSSTPTTKPGDPPVAQFTATKDPDDPLVYTFESLSTDKEDSPAELLLSWDFGVEGGTSSELKPTYKFPKAGTYAVSLKVTDTSGLMDVETRQIQIVTDVVVNSTGDAPATDPVKLGCDTGAKVDDETECTLRAAIETVNRKGGGPILFRIKGDSVPIITTTGLPGVTVSSAIDATTQAATGVVLRGPADKTGLALSGGTSTVKGFTFQGFGTGVDVSAGSGHQIEANRFGTSADGSVGSGAGASGLPIGVKVNSAGAVISQNQFLASTQGVEAGPGATTLQVRNNRFGTNADGSASITPEDGEWYGVRNEASGAVISDNLFVGDGVASSPQASAVQITANRFGTNAAGSAALGKPRVSAFVLGANTRISGNHAIARTVAFLVSGPRATGASVSNNLIGLNATGTAELPNEGYGIRIDAAPSAQVTGNRIGSSSNGSISITGSNQIKDEGDEARLIPNTFEVPGPVTGGKTLVRGNTIGLVGTSAVADTASDGVEVFGGASDVVIEDNTIAGQSSAAINILGGGGHRIQSNRLGWNAAVTERLRLNDGVRLQGVTGTIVGGSQASFGNDIGASTHGVWLEDKATDVLVNHNSIRGAKIGVRLGDVPIAGVKENTISGGEIGIFSTAKIAEIFNNRIGTADDGTTVVGNSVIGIRVFRGRALIVDNVIAGSGGLGVEVLAAATAELRANRIYQNGTAAIGGAGALPAPRLLTAIRSSANGTTRTVLLIDQLPAGEAGKIEIFAADSCSPAEAKYLVVDTQPKRLPDATATHRPLSFRGNASRRHFTITYTSPGVTPHTTALSNCIEAQAATDADGDGAADQIETIFDSKDDPTVAAIVTDRDQYLIVRSMGLPDSNNPTGPPLTVAGQLRNVAAVDDPDTGTRPPGVELPYGIIGFEVDVPTPGARTAVILQGLDVGGSVYLVNYWKYGPPKPGNSPRWYNFPYDEETGTGLLSFQDRALITPRLQGFELLSVSLLFLRDGSRGDSDLTPNGRIVDPGGPAIVTAEPQSSLGATQNATQTTIEALPTSSVVAPSALTYPAIVAPLATTPPSSASATVLTAVPTTTAPATTLAPNTASANNRAVSATTTTSPSGIAELLPIAAPSASPVLSDSVAQSGEPLAYTGSGLQAEVAFGLLAIAIGLLLWRKSGEQAAARTRDDHIS